MSSLVRRIERQAYPSRKVHVDADGVRYANPPRERFYGGRGKRLGVHNPEDKAKLAREARENRGKLLREAIKLLRERGA